MSTTPERARRGRAALWLASLVGALAASRCMGSGGGSCQPGDCPAGHSCAVGGGCKLQEGSCASDDDCAEGEGCATFSGVGILGSYTDTRCEPAAGEPGEPCGSGALGSCVFRSSCVYGFDVELSPDPSAAGQGSIYWLETRVAFTYERVLREPICVAYGSLDLGERCSGAFDCGSDLICHSGYTPKQCRPASASGGPCLESSDCAEGSCVLPELEPPDGVGPNNCARADPECDIRVDATCGHWLSCAQCVGAGG
jgi:hypothetical protein